MWNARERKKSQITTIFLARVIMWIIDKDEKYSKRSKFKMRAGKYWAQFEWGWCAYLLGPYWWNMLWATSFEDCSGACCGLEIESYHFTIVTAVTTIGVGFSCKKCMLSEQNFVPQILTVEGKHQTNKQGSSYIFLKNIPSHSLIRETFLSLPIHIHIYLCVNDILVLWN